MIEENRMPLLSIRNLSVELMTISGLVYAVKEINLDIYENEILGVVGESGCGKSMTAKSILRLHDERHTEYGGEILFEGNDTLRMSYRQIEQISGRDIAMIFQDPITTLNPLMTAGKQIVEMFTLHTDLSRAEAKERALKLFEEVGVTPAEKRFDQYPFELSGGQLQRISIAMSLACSPKLLIADEPTTALDVTMQAQILELLQKLRREHGTSIMLITHNFGVVAEVCSRVAVMYAGQIVESGNVRDIFDSPRHPYTEDLIGSIPRTGRRGEQLVTIPGFPPKLDREITGCPYAPRCTRATELCRTEAPGLHDAGGGHLYLCHLGAGNNDTEVQA